MAVDRSEAPRRTARRPRYRKVARPVREQQILAVAGRMFATRGYQATSMEEIADGVGVSKPMLYRYFGSKDGLYLACLHHVAGGLLSRLEEAELEVDDTVASRIHPLRAVFEALEPQRDAWRLLYDVTKPATGPIPAASAGYQERTAELAASGSERFLRARGIHSSLDASALTAVWMGVVNSLVTWWLDHPEESAEAMIERCYRLLGAILG
jgi:AcrR family transcriptional regulator